MSSKNIRLFTNSMKYLTNLHELNLEYANTDSNYEKYSLGEFIAKGLIYVPQLRKLNLSKYHIKVDKFRWKFYIKTSSKYNQRIFKIHS